MGEAFSGRTPGKKAMFWGAMAQSIPDIDFIASSWMDTGQTQEKLNRNYSAGLKTFQITCKSHIR